MPDILQTPWWITVVRGFQVLFSLIVFALAATIIHDVYLEELGLCIATGLITWIVTAYLIATEKAKSIQHLYHIIAVLCLEAFMVILWLATFAATAARRAGFVYNVSVDDCYNDGSTINSSHCSYLKRSLLLRRGAVLFKTGQGLMSGAAGLGALVWLLYIVTFVWTVLMFTRGRKEGRFIMSSSSPSQDHQLEEAKTETVHLQQQQQQPPMNQQVQQQQPTQQYSPGHQTVAAQQHQYPPTPVTQPYAPSPDTHYTGMASIMSPSTPSEVASHNHQSELASHGPHSGQPVQMPTYDEHYHQADYAQHHSAELPAMQATYMPQ